MQLYNLIYFNSPAAISQKIQSMNNYNKMSMQYSVDTNFLFGTIFEIFYF